MKWNPFKLFEKALDKGRFPEPTFTIVRRVGFFKVETNLRLDSIWNPLYDELLSLKGTKYVTVTEAETGIGHFVLKYRMQQFREEVKTIRLEDV